MVEEAGEICFVQTGQELDSNPPKPKGEKKNLNKDLASILKF